MVPAQKYTRMMSLRTETARKAVWLAGLAAIGVWAVCPLHGQQTNRAVMDTPPDVTVVGYLRVTAPSIGIPIPERPISYDIGDRLALFQESRNYYIARTFSLETGEALTAFPKQTSQGQGTAWVTGEQLVIFGLPTPSVPGVFYATRGESFPVLYVTDTHYTVLIEKHGWDVIYDLPRNIDGLTYRESPKPLQVSRKPEKITKEALFRVERKVPSTKRRDLAAAKEKDTPKQPTRSVREIAMTPEGELKEIKPVSQPVRQASTTARKPVTTRSKRATVSKPSRPSEPAEPQAKETEVADATMPTTEKPSWLAQVVEKLTSFAMFLNWGKADEEPAEPGSAATELAAAETDDGQRTALPALDTAQSEFEPVEPAPESVAETSKPALAQERPSTTDDADTASVSDIAASTSTTAAATEIPETADPTDAAPEDDSGAIEFLSANSLLFQILLVVIIVLAVLVVRLQSETRKLKSSSEQIETYFTVGESTGSNYFEDLAQESGDFSGSLSGFSMMELIHFLNSSQETGTLALKDGKGDVTGHLFFEHGELIDAAYGKAKGEEAVYELLKAEENASFTFNRTEKSARKTSIKQQTMSLLLEASKQLDEERAG